jgi:hypothetical protein
VGCLLGHCAAEEAHPSRAGALEFLEQIKAPIVATEVLDKYPNSAWHHHTLHYQGPEVEAWGLNAACLYFRIRPWDCSACSGRSAQTISVRR